MISNDCSIKEFGNFALSRIASIRESSVLDGALSLFEIVAGVLGTKHSSMVLRNRFFQGVPAHLFVQIFLQSRTFNASARAQWARRARDGAANSAKGTIVLPVWDGSCSHLSFTHTFHAALFVKLEPVLKSLAVGSRESHLGSSAKETQRGC